MAKIIGTIVGAIIGTLLVMSAYSYIIIMNFPQYDFWQVLSLILVLKYIIGSSKKSILGSNLETSIANERVKQATSMVKQATDAMTDMNTVLENIKRRETKMSELKTLLESDNKNNIIN